MSAELASQKEVDLKRVYDKSPAERLFYAALFEFLGIVLSAPLMSWIYGHPLFDIGVITIVIAIVALLLNCTYNYFFDRLLISREISKTQTVRIIHMVGFEATLLLFTIPIICWFMNMNLVEALVLDAGYIVFYLLFTYFYNLTYDYVRLRYFSK
ncbi:PACE efflux transporter [Taylorella equigenitalis]|uniref:Chlorhexidine efflux transporter domain-containing protein n=1 Tax=Taylorella equigenitalis 14/56 TaxID=1091497 RepID=I7IB57_9BURK|nr:PACE efflux transporter [Taylorella equigenitalis]ASY31189.1 hypothetical protein B9Z30_07545 [Taylorella equigenitalis]ASY38488.1 hypothetical protein CA605_07465 [Taylorella equigenitalis]ASY42958.1 hypothetical protein CA943_07700 [Taylorella equigenitalis]KGK33719.1 hypothetical protein LW90_02955 [Taylorella equigenitalis]KOS59308.1 hypothetical protein AM589_01955 [Taylorella equigenitalis]